MPLSVGARLGPYEIVAPIGAGGMGDVYRAHDQRLGRDVAIKVSAEQFSERFEREAHAIAALNHPHICALYDVGPDYLVMEYIEGSPLEGPLPVAEAVRLAMQIADALTAAHAKGIVHRDLKPSNVLVTAAGVKLLDFGLAKFEHPPDGGDATVTQTVVGTVLGTAAYMAPEQAVGKPADPRSDIFSFGAVLYELLSGRRAFHEETPMATMAAVIHKEPRPFQAPPDLGRIVTRCLNKSPAGRFQTAADLKAALAAVGAGEPAPSIAVLPFANLSADKENEYFGDGLAEEIINALTQVPGLRVIARTSAFVFRDKQEDVRRIAEMLGVANVLQGSVRKAGNRIRVTAQLITAVDATQVWSNRYDREMSDVFAVQDEIAQAVVDALRDRLGAPVTKQIAQRQTADIEAYHLYVEGRHYLYKYTPDGIDNGQRLFEEALVVDPSYALPLVELAHCYWLNTMTRRISTREGAIKGIRAAERAVALDPTLGEALGIRAFFRALYEYRWAEALEDMERAMEINPASALTSHGQAVVLAALNRLSEAVHKQEYALKADPFSPRDQFFMARLLVCLREDERAAKYANRAIELAPDAWLAHGALGLVQLRTGKIREAIRALEIANGLGPVGHYLNGWRGCGYVLSGETDKAERLLQELREMAAPVPAAMIHAQLGNTDAAFDQLEAAVHGRDFQLYNLQMDPAFDKLRSDPRYEHILRLMKLPA